MVISFEKKIEKYVELIVKVGLNIQKDQTLVISASITEAEFVRKVCRAAYQQGAHYVYVDWFDEQLSRIEHVLGSEKMLEEVPSWIVKGYEEMAENGAAFLYITSPNFENLDGIDLARIDKSANASALAFRSFTERLISMQNSWTVIAVPTDRWAKKVFPHLKSKERIEALWEAIFHTTRVNEASPLDAWQQHIQTLDRKAKFLNDQQFHSLNFKGPGTNLTIELPENHQWVNGCAINAQGNTFIGNLPTEEVYTTPLKFGVNGVVQITKPIYYGETLINDVTLTFEKGRIIDFSAKEGFEILKWIIDSDEGSRYIGEVALVPYNSLISTSNLIYYHTLFDENASCHIALGNALTAGLKNDHEMTIEDREEQGINNSMIHVDIMIGSEQLQINGERVDGTIMPIFIDGNWATMVHSDGG